MKILSLLLFQLEILPVELAGEDLPLAENFLDLV